MISKELIPKSAAKLLLFFDMTKYICKKMHFSIKKVHFIG